MTLCDCSLMTKKKRKYTPQVWRAGVFIRKPIKMLHSRPLFVTIVLFRLDSSCFWDSFMYCSNLTGTGAYKWSRLFHGYKISLCDDWNSLECCISNNWINKDHTYCHAEVTYGSVDLWTKAMPSTLKVQKKIAPFFFFFAINI